MANLKVLNTPPKKKTRTTVDTILITPELVKKWLNPPFQRPLRINEKVRALATTVTEAGGVIPGVITLGVMNGETYLLDGQHRREAFLLSECAEGYTDIRRHYFESIAEMGEEFVNLNSQLVRMRPDDMLRGLEGSYPAIGALRKACPFVGYDQIRRGAGSPILSMSAVLRCWTGATADVPKGTSESASHLGQSLTGDVAKECAEFLTLAEKAWGRDPEYHRLWGGLNLTLCMWFYRRTVLSAYSAKSARLTREQFGRCLMSLSANSAYLEWLTGRMLSDRDRSPGYGRIKIIFVKRLFEDMGKKAILPAPAWVSHHGRGGQ